MRPYATSDTWRTTDRGPESASCRASFASAASASSRASFASAAANTLASYAGVLRIGRVYFVKRLRCTPGGNIRDKVNILGKYYSLVCRQPADAPLVARDAVALHAWGINVLGEMY